MNWRAAIGYYADFVVYPPAAIVLTVMNADGPLAAALWGFGLVLFTFAEYWTHRTVLHHLMWHGQHQRHHVEPAEFVVFPWWYVPAMLGAAAVVMRWPIFIGFLVGYCWFICWHHVLHHWDLRGMPAWVRRYATWHEMHHHKTRFNFGITHPLWDVLFGTYRASGALP